MRRLTPGRIAPCLLGLAAGLLAAVTYDQAAARAEGRQEIREALVNDIQDESAVSDDLAARLEEVRAEVSRTSDELLAEFRAADGRA